MAYGGNQFVSGGLNFYPNSSGFNFNNLAKSGNVYVHDNGYSSLSSSNDFNNLDYFSLLREIANSNTAASQAMAREQMGFQASQAEISRKFNSAEAEKARQWQEMMSNTSHQREVNDLVKAGLNPVLSANHGATTPGGSSASSAGNPSGAMGHVDTSLISALVNLATATMNNSTSIRNAQTNLQGVKYSSDKSYSANLTKSLLGLFDFF